MTGEIGKYCVKSAVDSAIYYQGDCALLAASTARETADTLEVDVVVVRCDGTTITVRPSSHPQGPSDYVNDRV